LRRKAFEPVAAQTVAISSARFRHKPLRRKAFESVGGTFVPHKAN